MTAFLLGTGLDESRWGAFCGIYEGRCVRPFACYDKAFCIEWPWKNENIEMTDHGSGAQAAALPVPNDLASLAEAVLARHPDFCVAIKPHGLSFHDESGSEGFVSRLKRLPGNADLYPLHRLDRITSGLILFARTPEAAKRFGEMFANGQIEKYYLAISAFSPSKKQGWVKGLMQKARGGSWRLARASEGPFAVTQFFSFGTGRGKRLFLVRPRTGRTHQIRVALKSLSAPILGDDRYGGGAADRGYLHAFVLRFDWTDGPHCFISYPQAGREFCEPAVQELISSLAEPWTLAWPRWQGTGVP